MTAAFDDHFDGTSDKWSARLLTWLAHSIVWLLPIALFTSLVFWLGPDWNWLRISNATMWTLIFFSYVAATFHQVTPRLCIKCMQEVPANAAEKAQDQRFFLLSMHLSGKAVWCLLIVTLTCIYVPPIFWDDNNYVQILTIVIPDIYIGFLVYGMWLHHSLRPWCPYCRHWDDGGEAELIPNPDPSESRKA